MSRTEEPDICGKPITDLSSFGNNDRVGLPIHRGLGIAVCTVCLLPPGHEGRCKDAKIVPLHVRPCTQGEA